MKVSGVYAILGPNGVYVGESYDCWGRYVASACFTNRSKGGGRMSKLACYIVGVLTVPVLCLLALGWYTLKLPGSMGRK